MIVRRRPSVRSYGQVIRSATVLIVVGICALGSATISSAAVARGDIRSDHSLSADAAFILRVFGPARTQIDPAQGYAQDIVRIKTDNCARQLHMTVAALDDRIGRAGGWDTLEQPFLIQGLFPSYAAFAKSITVFDTPYSALKRFVRAVGVVAAEGRKIGKRSWCLCSYLRRWRQKKWSRRFPSVIHALIRKDANVNLARLTRTLDDVKSAEKELENLGLPLQMALDLRVTIEWLPLL
jgi:hypothetical protein